MKQITIRVDKYGKISNTQDLYLKFANENLTTEVTVDFEGVKEWYTDYVKYAYIFVGKTKRGTFYTSTGNTLTFLLTQEDLQTGYITIQPAAKLPNVNPELIKHVQWEHIKFDIKKSFDPITQDTTITLSLAELLQNEIDLINIALAELQDDIDNLSALDIQYGDGTVEEALLGITQNLIDLQDTKVDKEVGKGLSSNDYTDSEKSKLATIEEGAEVNVVTSVASRVGDVVLTKTDVGLLNVDNTSDLDKPISTATQLALNGKANTVHTHVKADITDFAHTHPISEVVNLQTALDGKVDKLFATNLVTNGDFSNGITGWTLSGVTQQSIVNNVLTISVNTTGSLRGIIQNMTLVNGNRYYIVATVKPARNSEIRLGQGTQILYSVIPNVAQRISNTFVASGNNISYEQVSTAGDIIELSFFNLINLTQLFGTGNEPTKEQMDYLLSNFPNSWFNGTVELTNYRQLLNLVNTKANRVQEAWISATLIGGASNISGLTSRYKKDDSGVVWVELYYTGSFASFTKIMDFPVGYRPTQQIFVQGQSAYAYGNLYIDINGGVVHATGTSTNNNRYLFCFRTN